MHLLTVRQVIADVVEEDLHLAEVCRLLEAALDVAAGGDGSDQTRKALSAARAVMARLDPETKIRAIPKWV